MNHPWFNVLLSCATYQITTQLEHWPVYNDDGDNDDDISIYSAISTNKPIKLNKTTQVNDVRTHWLSRILCYLDLKFVPPGSVILNRKQTRLTNLMKLV